MSGKSPFLILGDRSWSHGQAFAAVSRMMDRIGSLRLGAGDWVAVYVDRPDTFVFTVLALIRLRCGFMPLPSDYPAERARELAAAYGVSAVLTDLGDRFAPAGGDTPLIELPDPSESGGETEDAVPAGLESFRVETVSPWSADDGMTVSRTREWYADWIDFTRNVLDIDLSDVLAVYEGTRDLFHLTWLGTWLLGGTLELVRAGNAAEATARNTVVCPLRHAEAVLPELRGHPRVLLTFGEETFDPAPLLASVEANGCRWYNVYGFPQTAFITRIRRDDRHRRFVHAGKPAKHQHAMAASGALEPAPLGAEGRLVVKGAAEPDGGWRKTFFDARLEDGMFHLWPSRPDHFVLGGERGSLDRIRGELLDGPGVRDAHAEFADGNLQLYLSVDRRYQADAFRAWFRTALPGAFASARIDVLPSVPRDGQGRVDRRRLADLEGLDADTLRRIERLFTEDGRVRAFNVTRVFEPEEDHMEAVVPARMGTEPLPGRQPEREGGNDESQGGHDGDEQWSYCDGGTLDRPLPDNLTDAFLASASGNREILFIDDDGARTILTYAELLERAASFAEGLRAAGAAPGVKIILQLTGQQEYIVAFWGSVLGGFVPVPMPAAPDYGTKNEHTERLAKAWPLLDRPLVVASDALLGDVVRFFRDRSLPEESVHAYSALCASRPGSPDFHRARPDDPAVILFTSGSTGTPKGVVLSHRNLIRRSFAAIGFHGLTDADVSLNWMPMTHVGGLVMLHVQDTLLGCKQIHVSTQRVSGDPLLWLDYMDQFRATMSWAPNFAFGLVNERQDRVRSRSWDLRHVHTMLNGGEPVVPRTVRKFAELLREHGLRQESIVPAYGMTELTSGVTFNRSFAPLGLGENELFVSVGAPIPGVRIRVVGENGEPLPAGAAGRVQVAGDTLMLGYHNNPEATAAAMGLDGWFDTGDYGFIRGGELVITGRGKDILNVNGVNYYCQDIEAAVEELEEVTVSFCAACGVRSGESDTDELAVFFHPADMGDEPVSDYLNARGARRIRELLAKIRQKVVAHSGLNPAYIIPLAKDRFPKTEIGKIQRTRLKKEFESGAFADILHALQALSEPETERIPAWFYGKRWVAAPLPVARPSRPRKARDGEAVVLLGYRDEVHRALRDGLAAAGIRTVAVGHRPGCRGPAAEAPGRYAADLADADTVRELLHRLRADLQAGTGRWTVADLIPEVRETGASGIGERFRELIAGRLAVIRALSGLTEPPRKYVIVSSGGTLRPSDEPADPAAAMLPGLARSFGLEAPDIACAFLDVDAWTDADPAAAEILSPSPDPVAIIRGGRRLVPRLAQLADGDAGQASHPPLDRGTVVLVTGGLGGVGEHVCRWLQDHYDAKLILLGTREADELPAGRLRVYEALRSRSRYIHYAAAGGFEAERISAAVDAARDAWGLDDAPVGAIFHLAGSISLSHDPARTHWEEMDRHFLRHERPETFGALFDAKVRGALSLYEWRQRRAPGARMIVFSSVNGFFGGASLGAYSAVSALLESLCEQWSRTDPGIHCLSWSMWENVGLSAGIPDAVRRMSRNNGFEPVSVRAGLLSMEHALRRGWRLACVGLHPAGAADLRDFEGLRPVFRLQASLEAGVDGEAFLREKAAGIEAVLESADRSSMLARIRFIPASAGGADRREDGDRALAAMRAERLTGTEARLLSIWRDVLSRGDLNVNDNFFEAGGNSILMTGLIHRIRQELGVSLPFQALLEAQTVRKLARVVDRCMETEERQPDDTGRIDWEAETRPDPGLARKAAALRAAAGGSGAREESRVLLTGATGFIGSFLLKHLTEHTDARVYCLVRAASDEEAARRLRESLTRYGLPAGRIMERCTALAGDLSRPRFAWEERRYERLAEEIDAVYHNGAVVNFAYPYAMLKGANVDGTRRITDFAATAKLKPVHFTSTLAVFYSMRGLEVSEDTPLPPQPGLTNGYNLSKWAADRLVQRAAEAGIPVSIYRVCTATGDAESGICQTQDFIWLFLQLCVRLGCAPAFDYRISMMPVDRMGEMIVRLSSIGAHAGLRTFHLHPPGPVHVEQLYEWLQRYGYPLRVVSYGKWYDRLMQAAGEGAERPDGLLPLIPERDAGKSRLVPEFRSRFTDDALRGLGMRNEPYTESMFGRTLDYFRRIGFMPEVNGRAYAQSNP